MDLKKLNPWNWFKHEEREREGSTQVPVKREQINVTPSRQVVEHYPVARLHREVDRLFNEAFSAFGMPSLLDGGLTGVDTTAPYLPNVDVSGNEKGYEITLDVPGHNRDDLSLEVKGDRLVIKGHKEEKTENSDKEFYRMERHVGSFQRTLSLPDDASVDDITAHLTDGVLRLQIPRVETPEQEVKRIAIQH